MRNNIEEIVGCKIIDYFVENDEFIWSDSHPRSDSTFSMLHNSVHVAPVIIRVVSTCTASSCLLDCTDLLSHTESHYSNNGRIKDTYICSNDMRRTLNFSARIKLRLDQVFVVIACI